MSRRPKSLKRSVGLWQATLSGIGVILGAGIYALVGEGAERAGNALWLAFLIAGIGAALTVYSYTRFATLRPKNAAEFQYTSMAYGPRVGLIAGWMMLAADVLASATVALGFGGYLSQLVPIPATLGALLLLAMIAVVLLAGISESVGVAITLTLIEVAGLVVVIAVGAPRFGSVDYLQMPAGLPGIWMASALVLFAYLGFDELANLAEEMRRPKRDLPRALLLSLVVATGLYVLVAVAAVSAIDWRELAGSSAPLALVVSGGSGLGAAGITITLIALAATTNTVLLLLLSGSRLLYGLATSRVLPTALARVDRRRVPRIAVAIVVAATAGLLAIGDIGSVAALTNAAVLASFMLVHASLFALSMRRDPQLDEVRLLDRALPIAAFAVCGWLLWHTGWQSAIVAGLIGFSGWLLGSRLHRAARDGPSGSRS